MSLDVDLVGETVEVPCCCDRCGHEHAIKQEERLFSSNITHNLGAMAKEAGIYQHLWRPEEIGITKARQLIEPLRAGIALMKSDRERFEKRNAANGWGTYRNFVPFVDGYLAACEDHPDTNVRVSR